MENIFKSEPSKENFKRMESDLSIHPDYTKFKVPYRVICHQRYQNTIKKYDKQFAYELEMQESMQFNAYNAMRFHRHFVITTLWPPLHTRKEIDYTLNKMFKLTKKQDKRLKEILSGPVY